MKQRRLGIFAGAAMLGLLAIGCGSGAASPRGWAEPVQNGDTTMVSTGRGRIDGIKNGIGAWRFPDYWQIEASEARKLKGIYGAPVLSSDGDTVFLADYNGYVYVFKQSEALTATQVQSKFPKPAAATINLGEPIIGGLVIDKATNDLFVTAGPRLIRLKYQSGRLSADWTFKTGGDIWGVPVLASGGRVLITSLDGALYALNQATGAVAWQYDTTDGGLVSTPVVVGDTVYVGGFDSKLHAVDLASGAQKWTFQATYWVWSRPISDGSRVIFGDFSGALYAVNASDGAEAWSVSLDKGAIVGSPVISGGMLVVATQKGWLIGIDPSSREIEWQVKIDSSITADLVQASDGTVLIAPNGCITPEGLQEKTYYYGVNPRTGELRQAQEIC